MKLVLGLCHDYKRITMRFMRYKQGQPQVRMRDHDKTVAIRGIMINNHTEVTASPRI